MATHRRRRLLAAFLLFLIATTAHAVVVFAPPDDSPDAANELRGIERELADRNVAAAAKRLDALLAARGDPLASVGEGTLTSTAAWIDRLPAEQRTALANEYAKAFGKTATLLFESVRKSATTHPEDLYAVARRYPLTPAAGLALVEAGDRALQLGDLPAAQAYYEMAPRTGPPLNETRAARLEFLKQVNAGYPVTPPADLADTTAPRADRPPFIGPMPFDATWYGVPAMSTHPRFFPLACDDRILLATAKGVAMIRGDFGQVVWNSPNPKALPADRPVSLGRGPLFAPAVLSDIHGRPAVVVTRYPVSGGEDSQYVLRAISAADGKTLWTTDATDQPKDLSYAGLPAISGRFVYTLAVTKTGVSTGTLLLCAVDLSTGNQTWQATLGSVAEQGELRAGGRKNIRGDPLSFDAFAELSEPAVAGDCVYVAPNCGSIIAVGRFDGKVRWVHIYRDPEVPNAAAPREPRAKPNRWMDARDAQRAPLLRYRSTPLVCGDAVVVMPQDVPALIAVDRFGGRRLWETDIIEGFGLAGASGDTFVTCGASVVCGVDAVTAKLKWKVAPQKGNLTGPAVVHGQTVIVPTTGGMIQLNVRDGIERATYVLPNFRRLLNNESVRAVLADSYAPRSFGPPAGGR